MLRNLGKTVFAGIIVITILFGCSQYSQENEQLTALKGTIQAKLDSLHEVSGFPGATLAFVLKDGTKLQFAAGFSNLENSTEMAPSDRMFTGSTGKTFVAAVMLQLYDEGRFEFDEKISDYFGEEPWFSRLPNYDDITIRMLMNHTGGLPRYVLKEEFWDDVIASPDRVWQPVELLSYIFDQAPVHEAGGGWAYSDTDYIVLGMIIEKLCGNTFYDELRTRILEPHGLKHTSPSDKRILDGLITGYSGENSPFKLPSVVIEDGKYVINPQFEWTGGGLVTTSGDLASWSKLLYEGNIFSEESLGEMLQPVSTKSGQPDSAGYGLGVQIFKAEHGLVYGHSGTFPGYLTQMEYIPEIKCAAAIQVNADGFSRKLNRSLHALIVEFMPEIFQYTQNIR